MKYLVEVAGGNGPRMPFRYADTLEAAEQVHAEMLAEFGGPFGMITPENDDGTPYVDVDKIKQKAYGELSAGIYADDDLLWCHDGAVIWTKTPENRLCIVHSIAVARELCSTHNSAIETCEKIAMECIDRIDLPAYSTAYLDAENRVMDRFGGVNHAD